MLKENIGKWLVTEVVVRQVAPVVAVHALALVLRAALRAQVLTPAGVSEALEATGLAVARKPSASN